MNNPATRTTRLRVKGMRCAGCVAHVEKALAAVPGVHQVSVNLATEDATIDHAPATAPASATSATTADALAAAVRDAGYEAEPDDDEDDPSGAAEQTTLRIEGMHCASCVAAVERKLAEVPGVRAATVNLATHTATIERDPGGDDDALVAAVREAGYDAETERDVDALAAEARAGSRAIGESRAWRYRLIVFGVLAAAVMVLGMGWHTHWSAWVQLVLATPVQIGLGWPFYRGAWRALKHGRAEMDTLVALGTSVAFVYSAVATVTGDPAVYFETAAVILVFIGLGRWLETRARGSAASAIRELMQLQPDEASVVRDGRELTLPVDQVRVGDELLVRPGGRIAVDGQIIDGHTSVDQSMVTGESVPAELGPGDRVFAGTVNQAGAVRYRATATGKAMLLSQVVELVKRAQASKAGIQRLVDKVAGVFVPVVIVIAVAALLGWGLGAGAWLYGMMALVAVLIVACPCALGLATPTAIMVGTGLGARRGILIKEALALERAGRLTDIVLDKTGTLTQGKPEVTDVVAVGGFDDDTLLRLASAAEAMSEHPLARAIVEHGRERGLVDESDAGVEGFESITGGGVAATVAQQSVVVGRLATLRDRGVEVAGDVEARAGELEAAARTVVAVAVDGQVMGLIALADRPRPDAGQAVAALKALGLRTILLTGDNRTTAEAIGAELGVDETLAEVLPTDKQAKVAELQRAGRVVAMVGDGINDAPALASADLGIALGGGTDIAMDAGHVVLVGNDLSNLARAIRLSRATMWRIYFGLFWAFIYNLALIPVAVAGLLNPMLAAAAMALSSVSVVSNALYLRWSWRD